MRAASAEAGPRSWRRIVLLGTRFGNILDRVGVQLAAREGRNRLTSHVWCMSYSGAHRHPAPLERTTKNSTMPQQLVIVESPTKAKTLERYLVAAYSVTASKGQG